MAKKGWESRLKPGRGDSYIACAHNVIEILSNVDEWKGVLGYDQFAGTPVLLREPPWGKSLKGAEASIGDWRDSDTTRLSAWLSHNWDLHAGASVIEPAMQVVAEKKAFHPVRKWLGDLEWDKTPRLDDWLIRIGGADDNAYTRAVGAKFLISAIARVCDPGCKVDTVPIFEGAQGVGKSTMLRILFGEQWFLETGVELGSKDSYQMLRRKWGIELAELDSFGRTQVSAVKAFLSARVDTYRPSYGRSTRDFPRQCVFAGTMNPSGGGYLKDDTGARRFQPVLLRRMHFKALEKERDQLWAEALVRYRSGEAWHLQDPDLIAFQKDVAEERRQQDPWEPIIAKWVHAHKVTARKDGFTTHEILTNEKVGIGLRVMDIGRIEEMRVASILRLLGLTDTFRSSAPGRPRMYRLPPGQRITDTFAKKIGAR